MQVEHAQPLGRLEAQSQGRRARTDQRQRPIIGLKQEAADLVDRDVGVSGAPGRAQHERLVGVQVELMADGWAIGARIAHKARRQRAERLGDPLLDRYLPGGGRCSKQARKHPETAERVSPQAQRARTKGAQGGRDGAHPRQSAPAHRGQTGSDRAAPRASGLTVNRAAGS
jgi:hypothetical protein